MAENSPEHEDNLTLRDLFREIQQQRADVKSLREEVKGNVACEVKKLKNAQDLKWKFQGHKIQYEFNSSIADIATQMLWSVENGKPEYSAELCNELIELVKKRNKLIRIADSSSGGWETVRQYETNPVASDSEDESKIFKAESRALKRKRFSSRGRGKPATSTYNLGSPVAGASQQWGSGQGPRASLPQPVGRGKPFRGPFVNSYPGYAAVGGFGQPAPGPCFACGEFSHFRKDCPHVARPATVGGGIAQAGK